jgi:hypothetical protein
MRFQVSDTTNRPVTATSARPPHPDRGTYGKLLWRLLWLGSASFLTVWVIALVLSMALPLPLRPCSDFPLLEQLVPPMGLRSGGSGLVVQLLYCNYRHDTSVAAATVRWLWLSYHGERAAVEK